MRSKVVKTLALALILGVACMTAAQQPSGPPSKAPGPRQPKQKAPAEKSKLEEMLAEALRNNADIRVAAANLALAEAELNRTRLQVTQQVVKLYYAIESQKKVVAHTELKVMRLQRSGAGVSIEVLNEASQTLALAKAKLAELEAQMPGLLGQVIREAGTSLRQGGIEIDDSTAIKRSDERVLRATIRWLEKQPAGPMAAKIRTALEKPITVDYKERPFSEVLKDLEKKVPGLSLYNFQYVNLPFGRIDVTLRLDKPLPVAVVLQAIADSLPDPGGKLGCRFVVRDYGILVSIAEAVPPGAITVQEFMRQKPTDK